jgi:hypothetical protein
MSETPTSLRSEAGGSTEAQFTIRSMLIAMSIVAILAALVGPLVRRLQPDAQFRLLVAWGIWLAACVAWNGYRAKRRWDAERLAGESLLRLPMFDEKVSNVSSFRRGFNIVAAGLLTLLMLFVSSMMIVESRSSTFTSHVSTIAIMTFWGVTWVSRVVAMLWWRNNVRFCKNGILWDLQVVLWDYLIEANWSSSDPTDLKVRGIDQQNVDRKWTIFVPADRRADVQAILDQSIVVRPSLPIGSLAYELGRIPISKAIRHPQLFQYAKGMLVSIVAFGAVFYFIRNGVTGIAEFDHAIFVGFILSAFSASWRWRWTGKKAGRPLIRLSGWRDWRRLVPNAALAAIFYYLGNTVSWSVPGLAYVAGAGLGWVVAGGFTATIRSFDLRDNGVLLQGEFYWPWTSVKIVKWNRDGNGRLVLARGWSRVIGIVPREQREAVDALLAEKIAR